MAACTLTTAALGAITGVLGLALALARCSWQRARLAAEDARELSRPGGPDASWLAAVEAQAALGMVSPETLSALSSLGAPVAGCGSLRWELRLASGRPAWPAVLAASAAMGLATAAATGSAALCAAAACAVASATLDWAHRTASPALCVAQGAISVAARGAADPAVAAAAAAVAALQLASTAVSRGAWTGAGDAWLMPAWCLGAATAASLARGLAALALVALALRAALGRGRTVPLAPLLLLPWLVMLT